MKLPIKNRKKRKIKKTKMKIPTKIMIIRKSIPQNLVLNVKKLTTIANQAQEEKIAILRIRGDDIFNFVVDIYIR